MVLKLYVVKFPFVQYQVHEVFYGYFKVIYEFVSLSVCFQVSAFVFVPAQFRIVYELPCDSCCDGYEGIRFPTQISKCNYGWVVFRAFLICCGVWEFVMVVSKFYELQCVVTHLRLLRVDFCWVCQVCIIDLVLVWRGMCRGACYTSKLIACLVLYCLTLYLCCPTFATLNNLVYLFDWSVWAIWCVGFIVSFYPQSFKVLVGPL